MGYYNAFVADRTGERRLQWKEMNILVKVHDFKTLGAQNGNSAFEEDQVK